METLEEPCCRRSAFLVLVLAFLMRMGKYPSPRAGNGCWLVWWWFVLQNCIKAGLCKVAPYPVSFWQFPFCPCFALSWCFWNSLGALLNSQHRQKASLFRACKIPLAFFRPDLDTAFMSVLVLGFSSWADCHLGYEDRYPLETRIYECCGFYQIWKRVFLEGHCLGKVCALH